MPRELVYALSLLWSIVYILARARSRPKMAYLAAQERAHRRVVAREAKNRKKGSVRGEQSFRGTQSGVRARYTIYELSRPRAKGSVRRGRRKRVARPAPRGHQGCVAELAGFNDPGPHYTCGCCFWANFMWQGEVHCFSAGIF